MSHPFVRVSKDVVERYREFQKTSRPVEEAEDVALIVGSVKPTEKRCDFWNAVFMQDLSAQGMETSMHSLSFQLPAGLDIVGFLQVSELTKSVPDEYTIEQSNYFQVLHSLPRLLYRFFCVCEKESLLSGEIEKVFCFLYNENGDRLVHNYFNPVSWTTSAELQARTVSALINANFPLEINVNKNVALRRGVESLVHEQLQELKDRINSDDLFLQTDQKSIFVSISDSGETLCASGQISEVSTCLQLYQAVNEQNEEKRKLKELRFSKDRMCFSLMQRITGIKLAESQDRCVPVVYCEKGEFERICIPLKLKCVSIVEQDSSVSVLCKMMKEAVLRQLKSAELCLKRHSDVSKAIFAPDPFLFLPPLNHFVVLHYPAGVDDSELEEYRHGLHASLNLPLTKPLLRRGNAYCFPEDYGPYLRNVHEYVGKSGVNGKVYAVEGCYQYHHYMQENFNDCGWGCAYRSFQTVWSWFLLQGYTRKPVPSHRRIQETLVETGDKDRTFIGSKQWVGSLELSYCLSQLLDIPSRILSVSSGEEMETKARELSYHFQTQGTPVMIGGGVLAHTILGMDFNEDTGDVKFLVLDPHYTGDENIKTIVDKGWCGWKPVSFWEQSCFYNMLLPQRPHVI